MIHINQLSFRYNNSSMGALHNLSLHVKRGECILLCGESGCGKTTVTRLLNGLIPHYYEGNLSGSIVVNGVDVSKAELYETSRFVGSVFQNPRSQFFCVDTTSEIAFGCENMGLPVEIVRERIDQVAETMDLRNLLHRSIFNLSGGEKQKVACASIAAMQPDVLVLDEPTSNLDVRAIEDLKETLLSWKSSGKTIIIAEHRLYWLTELCDRVVYMQNGEIAFDVPMCEFMNLSPEKTRALGLRTLSMEATCLNTREVHEEDSLILKDYQFCYQKKVALDIPELRLPMGSVVALIGHNGAGKSTLAKCLCGLEKKFRGKTLYKGLIRNRKKMRKTSYMVMQDVNRQLFCEKVEDEIQLGMKPENANDIAEVLSQLNLKDLMERHPMSLSGGQKQRVAIASAILANKEILIFDEPTSGLDFRNMEKTAALLRALCGRNSVFIITHDPEFILRCCTHVVQMKEGKVVESYPLTMSTAGKLVDFFTL